MRLVELVATSNRVADVAGRGEWTVHVRPELVVETGFNDVQASPRYPGGLALRLARVKRYRDDKPASEADTFATVRSLYRRATGLDTPSPREK
jgi:DNA ligase-1